MNICIFYYDGFCEFEVVLVAAEFSSKHFNFTTVALENKIYISEEKQKFVPDKLIHRLNPAEIDLFIIPGGNPTYLYEDTVLKNFIWEMNKIKKVIAGICGGTELLAAYGVLDNKKCTGDSSGLLLDADYIDLFKNAIIVQEDVIVDGNIITSTGQAFVEFASKLGEVMNIYNNENEAKKTYKWYKNIKE